MFDDNKTVAVEKEARSGVVFTARVRGGKFGKIIVHLFVEGQIKSIGTIKFSSWEGCGGTESLFDRAFQKWVTRGLFYKTVKDPTLLSVLTRAQRERLENIPWYRKTFRFLRAEGSTYENPRFILTTDKSDLPDRYKRIIEVGEDVVQREETEQEEARKLRAEEKRNREKNLRAEHAQLINQIAKAAIKKRAVPTNSAKTLSELGLLEPSTSARSGVHFPGEFATLQYDFTEERIQHFGYIGFDSELQLISVDERLPKDNQIYLRKSV